jgi:hypothetical protein
MSLATAVVLLCAASASATPVFSPSVSNCKDRNCKAVELGGTVPGFYTSALPWTIQVFAGPTECLRLEVLSQEADLEMRVVSPDGSDTWLADDSLLTPCLLCPLAAIRTEDRNGWYTVHIGEWGGAAVQANFTLAYGRYSRQRNPNCTSFVASPAEEGASASPKGGESPAPDPGVVPGH